MSRLLRVIGVLLLVFLWVGLPVWTYVGWGTASTESLLAMYVLPVGLAWNLLWLGLVICVFRRAKSSAILLAAAILLLTIVGNSRVSRWLTWRLEYQFNERQPSQFDKQFRAVFVLGGCTGRLPSGKAEVNAEGQRIVSAAEYWHKKKASWIVTTGAQPKPDPNDASIQSKEILMNLGVPGDRILRIPADNTHEEIKAIKALVENPSTEFAESNGEVGLITSAFHMPRAMRLAHESGLEIIPLPTGYKEKVKVRNLTPTDLVPNSQAINSNTRAMREFLARLVGR